MRSLLIAVAVFVFSSVFFVPNVAAEIRAGSCASIGWPENTFGCAVDGSTWSINASDAGPCEANFQPDFSTCAGNYPGRLVCGAGQSSCCVPCVPIADAANPPKAYGEACTPLDTCENGTTCREQRCLRQVGTIGFGSACLDTSECGGGTIDNPGASLVCEGGRCTTVTPVDEVCTSDQDCQTLMGRENVFCNTGTGICQDVVAPGDEGEEEFIRIPDYAYCDQVPDGVQRQTCTTCIERGEPGSHVYTAVGCISTSGTDMVRDLVRLLMGASGGVSILSILAGAFLVTVSQGDSSKLKEAKALLTAAVSGLFFIIFSVFILQFAGVSILQIPGLG